MLCLKLQIASKALILSYVYLLLGYLLRLSGASAIFMFEKLLALIVVSFIPKCGWPPSFRRESEGSEKAWWNLIAIDSG
ncbi:hypothetical protein F4811DRAFT_537573 [Daldinia bambusicola]|nr:hypothetical protein F4811DRAFT_537573 [Daldinia bambusicola]